MTPELQSALKECEVSTLTAHVNHVRFRLLGPDAKLELEPYIQLREGLYDVRRIGAYTYLGGTNAVFRHIDRIGRYCAIAGGIVSGQAEHGVEQLAVHPMFSGAWAGTWPHLQAFYDANADVHAKSARKEIRSIAHRKDRIQIGNDVWIGYGVFIRRGVRIGDGAVIAAHSVVVSDVPPYAVVGGVPAKVIRQRFDDNTCQALSQLQWWNKPLEVLNGVDYSEPAQALERLSENCAQLPDWNPPTCVLHADKRLVRHDGVQLHPLIPAPPAPEPPVTAPVDPTPAPVRSRWAALRKLFKNKN